MKCDARIVKNINTISRPAINSLVELELIRSVANNEELSKLRAKLCDFYILPEHTRITKLAKKILRKYSKKRNIKQANSIMAATALIYGIPLYTENYSEYHYIPKLMLFTP